MVKLFIKYEVSLSTHFEDRKGDAEYRNWGGLGVLRDHLINVTENTTIQHSTQVLF